MVRKKLAVAILALSALQANIAGAMGLGNLSVRSALNQPLNAEIKLLDTGDLDPSQIKIRLAAPEDFQRAGVDRDFFLTNLRFDVEMDGRGGATVKITTREPVVEPYLNFVLEARWPSGRLLREFAVLLDPPTFSANQTAAAVSSAPAQPVKPRAVQPPVVKTETETAATPPPADMSLPAADKSGEYRVQVYDTLSKIAARFKPANDVSVAQTMIAIQRANPQVFIRNNVNLIKSGYVLRLPSAEEVRSVSADQAAQEIDAQTQAWRGGRSSGAAASAPAAGPQLDASAPEPSQKEGGFREQARLSIATTGDADKGGAGGGKGVDALRQQLTQSQEALEKGRRDNKELQSRLDDMERQIATLQRLISLKDDQLAALQTQSSGTKTAPQSAPGAATETAPTADASPAAQAPASAEVAAPAAAPAAKPAPTPAAAKPAAKPAPAPKPAATTEIVDHPKYYLWGGIAAIILGLLAAYIGKRRKAAQQESETPPFDDDSYRFDIDAFDNAPAAATAAAAEIETGAAETDLPEEAAAEAPKKPMRSETGDPIAESDIYIAYGRYQQAVDLLTHAIDAEPNRSDLRVKLLEVYVEMRNKEAFRQQFVALQALGDSDAIARVKDLLSSVDGIADWLDDLPAAPTDAPNSTILAASAATAAAVSAVSPAPELDLDLDFDNAPAPVESPAQTTSFDGGWSDDLAALESTETDEESGAVDLDLGDDFGATELESELSDSFLDDSEPVSRSTAAGLATSSFGTTLEEGGLELDLGDDDLDQALRNMGDAESLDDLEDMSVALGELDASPASRPLEAPVDLSTNFGELPEEFDLSQPETDLPEVERANAASLGELSFDESSFEGANLEETDLEETRFAETDFAEPSFEPAPEAQPEMDVFAGLSQPTPASVPTQPVEPPALDGGDDFDFLADADEVATKLDLARAYIDMGDTEGAKDILDEVLQEGTDTQRDEASTLLSRIG